MRLCRQEGSHEITVAKDSGFFGAAAFAVQLSAAESYTKHTALGVPFAADLIPPK